MLVKPRRVTESLNALLLQRAMSSNSANSPGDSCRSSISGHNEGNSKQGNNNSDDSDSDEDELFQPDGQSNDDSSDGDLSMASNEVINEVIGVTDNVAAVKKPRKSPDYAFTGNYCHTNLSQHQYEQALISIGQKHFGLVVGSPVLKWNMRNGAWRFPKRQPHTAVAKLRCAFHVESNCQWCVQVERDTINNTYRIEIGDIPHSDHQISTRKRGAPRSLLAHAFNSPGKVFEKPSKVVSRVRRHGMAVSTDQAKKIKRSHTLHKKKLMTSHLNSPISTETWGSITSTLYKYRKENLNAEAFNEHTTYLIGDEILQDAGKEELCAVLSTENLLLNAYRQSFFGQPTFFSLDTSYRYTHEKHGLLPVVTVAPTVTPSRHYIAYAILAKENQAHQEFALTVIKKEVERIVNERALQNIAFV